MKLKPLTKRQSLRSLCVTYQRAVARAHAAAASDIANGEHAHAVLMQRYAADCAREAMKRLAFILETEQTGGR